MLLQRTIQTHLNLDKQNLLIRMKCTPSIIMEEFLIQNRWNIDKMMQEVNQDSEDSKIMIKIVPNVNINTENFQTNRETSFRDFNTTQSFELTTDILNHETKINTSKLLSSNNYQEENAERLTQKSRVNANSNPLEKEPNQIKSDSDSSSDDDTESQKTKQKNFYFDGINSNQHDIMVESSVWITEDIVLNNGVSFTKYLIKNPAEMSQANDESDAGRNSRSRIKLDKYETDSKHTHIAETQKIFQKKSDMVENPGNRMTRKQYFNSSKMHIIKDLNQYKFEESLLDPK